MRWLFTLAALVVLMCAQTRAVDPVRPSPEALVKGAAGLIPVGITLIPSSKALPASLRAELPTVPMATAQSFSNYEFWTSVTIPAGGGVSLDSGINYASSDIVRVTFRSAAPDLGNLVAVASWSVPEIDDFNIQDLSLGSKYFFTISGGGVFSVSGTQFRLILVNNGTDLINLNSVLVIARSQLAALVRADVWGVGGPLLIKRGLRPRRSARGVSAAASPGSSGSRDARA
jgi:hypothetical protein